MRYKIHESYKNKSQLDQKQNIDLDKITPTMTKYNLIINKDKTEYVKLKRDTDRKKEAWRE